MIKNLETGEKSEAEARAGRYTKKQRKIPTPLQQMPPERAPSRNIAGNSSTEENLPLDSTPQGEAGVGNGARRSISNAL